MLGRYFLAMHFKIKVPWWTRRIVKSEAAYILCQIVKIPLTTFDIFYLVIVLGIRLQSTEV